MLTQPERIIMLIDLHEEMGCAWDSSNTKTRFDAVKEGFIRLKLKRISLC